MCGIGQIHQGESFDITSDDYFRETFVPKIEILGSCSQITNKRRYLGLVCMFQSALHMFLFISNITNHIIHKQTLIECVKAGKTLKRVTPGSGQDNWIILSHLFKSQNGDVTPNDHYEAVKIAVNSLLKINK